MTLDFGAWPIWAGALLIFFARVADVSLGTLRIAFISKGVKSMAPVIGFFEMLIWLFAISQLVQNLDNVAYYLAYAGGFAAGIYGGLRLEERIALGLRVIRTITREEAGELAAALRSEGFGVTTVRGEGPKGEVSLVFSVVKRTDVPRYLTKVLAHRPDAFYSIEEVREVGEGFPSGEPSRAGRGPLLAWRKGR